MIIDRNYNQLSDVVYHVDSKKANRTPIVKGQYLIDGQFKVIEEVVDNIDNGMQAMAVAPEINGEADTTQIVIAYAGTNSNDLKDIQTDVQMIFGGNTDDLIIDTGVREYDYVLTDAQSKTALEFAEKIRKKYRHATITTTGHSLGESLA